MEIGAETREGRGRSVGLKIGVHSPMLLNSSTMIRISEMLWALVLNRDGGFDLVRSPALNFL